MKEIVNDAFRKEILSISVFLKVEMLKYFF